MTELVSDEKLDELLETSPAARVTKEYMESRISSCDFTRIGETHTHCRIVLDNGFSVTGESACVNPEDYNKEIGERIAYDNAFSSLWQLFGFLLAEKNKLIKENEALYHAVSVSETVEHIESVAEGEAPQAA